MSVRLFDPDRDAVPGRVLRDESHFGRMDALTGLPRRSYYSLRLTGDRLAAYDRGYTAGLREGARRGQRTQ